MNLALFDFDGTITRKDSLVDFLKFTFGPASALKAVFSMSLLLIGYKLGFVSDVRIKEKVFTWFFKGLPEEKILQLGQKYANEALPGITRESALKKIKEHLDKGDDVVIVTASIEYYVRPYASLLGTVLIATKMEVIDGRLTGRLSGANCRGPEKARRIRAEFDLEKYTSIYAYGDSPGDREMLALADYPFMKHFL